MGGVSARAVRSGDAVVMRIVFRARVELPELTVGVLIRDRLGNDVFGTNTFHLDASRANVKSGEVMAIDFAFPQLNLGVGSYSLTVALHARDTHIATNYDWWDRSLVFQVVPGRGPASVGVCTLPVTVAWQAAVVDGGYAREDMDHGGVEALNAGSAAVPPVAIAESIRAGTPRS
ncbi:MAG: Wzt carbohydrate-binding domain-containing protein [Pseudomonadota bacterium]|nr:Wzt carbohydrate-binding domain-containing protein [Pseudomonadota bacterium]